jgi:hypothetical protein
MHLAGGALERTLRLPAIPTCGVVVATSATASVRASQSVYLVLVRFDFPQHLRNDLFCAAWS